MKYIRNNYIISIKLITILILLINCSSNKKDNETIISGDVETYKSGLSSLQDNNYSKAVKEFDKLYINHPFSSLAKKSEIMTAYSLYQNNEINKSISKLKTFNEMNPKDEFSDYAHYLLAMCYYIQISSQGRDPSLSLKALNSFKLVMTKYPNSRYAKDSKLKIQFIKNSLAINELNIGKFYLKKNAPASSIKRFKTILKKYQNSSVIPETLYRLTEALLMMGLKKEAIKSDAILKYNFPNSEWSNLSKGILSNISSTSEEESFTSSIKNYFVTIFD
ncbi:outer membrane protein assembly factor BamD [Alphaproteobacteria bacterium]|nr:outer membrane protein assembly factor BamD [Alphaproteobacteria bacterium]